MTNSAGAVAPGRARHQRVPAEAERALCVMWFMIDDDSSSIWFYWPMIGSGIAVAITGIVLLGIGGLFGVEWEWREIDKYLRRRGTEPGQ
jgi:hypothetical protein